MGAPVTCDVCGRLVEQPKRGYRDRHTECRTLHEDIQRMTRHLEQLAEGSHPAAPTPAKLAQLWLEVFSWASLVPRRRDKLGRYVSSGLSPEYARARDTRRRRKTSDG